MGAVIINNKHNEVKIQKSNVHEFFLLSVLNLIGIK